MLPISHLPPALPPKAGPSQRPAQASAPPEPPQTPDLASERPLPTHSPELLLAIKNLCQQAPLVVPEPGSQRRPGIPIPAINPALQAPAKPEQRFQLTLLHNGNYDITPLCASDISKPQPTGVFNYVVQVEQPDLIVCGLTLGTPQAEADPRLGIVGHTSLSNRAAVLFAGTFQLEKGQLMMWGNDSGHYQVPPEVRHHNLSASVKALLPESLFRAHGSLPADEQVKLQNARGYRHPPTAQSAVNP